MISVEIYDVWKKQMGENQDELFLMLGLWDAALDATVIIFAILLNLF